VTDTRDRPPLARLLGAGARGADMVAHATGVDRAIDDVIEEAVVRAMQSEGVERAVVRLIDRNAIQEAIAEALTSEEIAMLVVDAVSSETADRVVEELMESEHFQLLLQRVIGSPGVRYALRSAVASQGAGIVSDIGVRLSKITARIDNVGERVAGRGEGEEETVHAGLATRAAAGGVDACLLIGSFTLLSGILAAIAAVFTTKNLPAWVALVFGIVGLLLAFTLIIGFWVLAGQTPGMRFLGIRLEPSEPSVKQAVKRLLAIPVALIPFGLGFLAILRDPRRRGWHDRFAGTEVVFATRYGIPKLEDPAGRSPT
jgi:uncharacterized RDD family membrane protein YckC